MPTTTWGANKDARIASPNLGAGASNYLPVGKYSGYLYRSLIGFAYSFSGMTAITAATLYVKTSGQYYVAFGSDPDTIVQRLTSSWSEGTSVSLSSSNAVNWSNQPSATSSHQATKDVSTSENTWVSIDITAMIQDAFAAGTFYGVRLIAVDETAASDVTEFYSREFGSFDAYISVTYTNNVPPNAPTGLSPADTSRVAGINPTLAWTHSDPDGDVIGSWDLQVSREDPAFGAVGLGHGCDLANKTLGIIGGGPNVSNAYSSLVSTYGAVALTRGFKFYWRTRTTSQTGDLSPGAWSAARYFKTNSLPVVASVDPATSGILAHLVYTAGAGWASPRLFVKWSVTDADADAITKYRVVVTEATTSGGVYSQIYDSGQVTSSVTSLTIPANLTEGRYYKVYVDVFDGFEWGYGGTGGTTGFLLGGGATRARWGTALYRFDMTSAPTTRTLTTLNTTTPANTSVVMEYGSNTTTSTPGTFYSSIGGAPLNRYFFYKVWLLAWGAATPTTPSLDKLVVSYSLNVLAADKWTQAATAFTVDQGDYVYGTQSITGIGDGVSQRSFRQLVPILPNTDYVLSARMKTLGTPDGHISLGTTPGGNIVIDSPHTNVTSDWSKVQTPVWNSGANTEIYVQVWVGSTTGQQAWYDAVKLEASTVVTPWTPGFIGPATVLDAGGLQIDGSDGGIFRLRGTNGAARSLVELGTSGLQFGGDTLVSSNSATSLTLADAATGVAGVTLHVGGTSGGLGTAAAKLQLNTERPWLFEQGSSGAGTYLRLHPVNAGKVLRIEALDTNQYVEFSGQDGATASRLTVTDKYFMKTGGAAFPAAPNANDRYFRTDKNMEFYYDGTRWVSSQLFIVPLAPSNMTPPQPLTATSTDAVRAAFGLNGGTDLWLVDHTVEFFVSGGTALGASHKWVGTMHKQGAGGADTTLTTINIDSGTSSVYRETIAAIGVLMGTGTNWRLLATTWTKTGTPGNLFVFETISYRIVTT